MLLETLNTARDLGRMHEIATVLIRHGLGDTVRRLGVAPMLERAGRVVHWRGAEGLSKEPHVRAREALEQLGPTFVKLGQVLAGRPDLLPPAWTEEFSRLHERAAPVPYEELHRQLTEDLGGEPEELFHDFDPTPLAAASIAQVHRATLEDGTPVVLKVRRPGIDETVDADMRLLTRLAERAEERIPELSRLRPRTLVRQFSRSMRDELDLRIEARNAERIRANLSDDEGLVVPRIHSRWTRERLCVMDFLEGPSIGEWLRSGMPGDVDPARIADRGADAVFRTIFVHGLFHADPHPGNLILLPDGRLGLVDFGMVGHLSESRRDEFLDLLMAVVTRNVEEVADTLQGWSGADVDMDLLRQDCAAFIDRYQGVPLGDLDVGAVLTDLITLIRENDLFLPNDVALLLKTFITLEGLGRQLDPNFVMATRLAPFAEVVWRERHSPPAIVLRNVRALGAALTGLPQDLRQIVRRMRSGHLRVEVDLEHLDSFAGKLDRSVNRLTVGLITSALIIGTSISLSVSGGPRFAGLPLFGFLGFASSIAAGVWVLWSIRRSKRS